MASDHYAPCPCGSGKKLKFCKCVDNLLDFEKITRLIEGGQEVAALDRINQLLKKTPNTAWLLAVKAELALGMQDRDLFRETADRFHKLKPDNPLALVMQSVVCSMERLDSRQAAQYLLQGLAESREFVPPLVIPAIHILLDSLRLEAKANMGGFWESTLIDLAEGVEQRSRPLNLVLRGIPKALKEPAGAPWRERLSEVMVLSRSFRFEQAEKKLQAILRDYPDQPRPLSELLKAQYAQLDQAGAAVTARKLAACATLPEKDRAFYLAISWELDSSSLKVPTLVRHAQIDSEQRAIDALNELDFVHEAPQDLGNLFKVLAEADVPPRQTYYLFSSPLKAAQVQDEPATAAPAEIGMVSVFGRETDRAPSVCLFMYDLPSTNDKIKSITELLQLGDEVESRLVSKMSESVFALYGSFLQRQRLRSHTLVDSSWVDELISIPFPALGGSTPQAAVQDDSLRLQVLALLTHFEGNQELMVAESAINELYQRLGLVRPIAEPSVDAKSFDAQDIMQLVFMDCEQLPADAVFGLFEHATMVNLPRRGYHLANQILARESGFDDHMLLVATIALLALEPGLERRLELTHIAEKLLSKVGRPPGEVIVARFEMLASIGRADEAVVDLQRALQQYPEDPNLLGLMQYLMQSMPQAAARRSGVEATRPSGLVLPGEPASAPAGGESKLWLPGS